MLTLVGCNYQQSDPAQSPKKELLIYCGTTMARAVRELADTFEQRENCVVKILKEGSAVLAYSISVNKVGDLYLPGDESYLDDAIAIGLVVDDRIVGCNRAILEVARGNPLNISPDLHNFVNGRYRTALASAECASVGKEAKEILQRYNLYEAALGKALLVLPDSRALTSAIVSNKVDLTINWLASAAQYNDDRVNYLFLDHDFYKPKLLRMGLLKMSLHPQLAQHFMQFASSAEGAVVFKSYGLGGAEVYE